MSQAVLHLETLTCPSCVAKIESALTRTEGVEDVKVLFNSSRVKVGYQEDTVNTDKLKEIVEKLGYEVKRVR